MSRRTVKRARKDAREEQEAEARGQRLAEIERVKAEAKQEAQVELLLAKAEVMKLKAENADVNSVNAKQRADIVLLLSAIICQRLRGVTAPGHSPLSPIIGREQQL